MTQSRHFQSRRFGRRSSQSPQLLSQKSIVKLLLVVLPLSVNQIIAWGTIYFSFSLFIDPMQRDLQWSRNFIAGGISLALLVSAVVQLFVGRFIDRYGAHFLMSIGALLGAAALLFLSVNTSLVGYYVAWTALGFTIALCFFEPAFKVLLDELPVHFEQAVSMLVLLSGLSSALFLPLAHRMIQQSGWRDALLMFGVLNLVSAAISWLLFCRRRRRYGRNDDEACAAPVASSTSTSPSISPSITTPRTAAPSPSSTAALHMQYPQAATPPLVDGFKQWRFWCVAFAFALNTGVVTTLVIHLLGILGASGFTARSALVAIAMIGPTQIFGRLVQTFFAGRSSFRLITVVAFFAFLVGLLCLQVSVPSGWLIWIAILLVGMGSGMMTILRGTIVALLFGQRDYARLSNLVAAPSSVARAIAPLGASMIAATTIGYRGLGWIVCVIAACALAFISYSLIAYQNE